MKNFKQFIAKIPPILIPFAPMHGAHSSDKKAPTMIDASPMHGKHSQKNVNEALSWAGKKYNHPVHHMSDGEFIAHNPNPHLGVHIDSVHKKINHSENDWADTPHIKEVKRYTSSSNAINTELINRAHGKVSLHSIDHPNHKWVKEHGRGAIESHTVGLKADAEGHARQVAGIDTALSHHKLEHDLHVFHGTTNFNPGELASKHPHRLIKSPAYMSTSINPANAHGFAGAYGNSGRSTDSHILHIHLKKGQHGIYAGNHSHCPQEKEFLLPRNTTLKVHPTPTKLKSGATVWHAHVHDE